VIPFKHIKKYKSRTRSHSFTNW